MKRSYKSLLALAAMGGFALSSPAVILVNDTWADGTRNNTVPGGDSAWYWGGAGSLTVVAPGGPMRGDLGAGGASSAGWTTYFSPEAQPAILAKATDKLILTWQFSLTSLGAANTSQNFRLAVVDTPSSARLSTDVQPGSAAYAGYGMFMNMSDSALANANPFRLMERTAPATASALLSASASWTGLANGATAGNTGYAAGVTYTYKMELTRNASSGLDIVSSMTGGSFNNTGVASISYTDTTPNSFVFDTFSIRPSGATTTAQIFDTSSLIVELIPEPSSFALAGLGLFGIIALRRNRL
jgi:hypothetical protein